MNKLLKIEHKNTSYNLAYFERKATEDTILYLHGLGTSKEDFLPAKNIDLLRKFNLVSFDFPGCGQSSYDPKVSLSIDDLVAITDEVAKKLELNSFHLIGHSMGGLTALLYAKSNPGKVKSFINVEGNLAPVDCRVFSEYVCNYPTDVDEKKFFLDFKNQIGNNGHLEFDKFLSNLEKKVTYNAIRQYCQSIFSYCLKTDLLSYFKVLNLPKMFIYGEENNDLPYIGQLNEQGVAVSEIPGSNHFPFYSNPETFFNEVAEFYLNDVDK